jgi:hypothetical protein
MSLRAKRSNLLGYGEIAASFETPRDDIMTQSVDPESTIPTHLDSRVPSPERLWRVGDFHGNDNV